MRITANELAQIINSRVSKAVEALNQNTFKRGVVSAVSADLRYVDVKIEGNTTALPNIICIETYRPRLDDRVLLLSIGSTGTNYVCLGALDPATDNQGWQEIGRTTLTGVADTVTVSGLPARKYLRIRFAGIASGGTLDTSFRFNNDSGSNYAYRLSVNGAAGTSEVSQPQVTLESGATDSGQLNTAWMDVTNISNKEKSFRMHAMSQDAVGAATPITVIEYFGKWANTSAAINRIDWINGGTGDFAIGSEVVVEGKD